MVENSNRQARELRPQGAWFSFLLALFLAGFIAAPARCQSAAATSAANQVHVITPSTPILLAQVASPGVLPTDATKGNLLQDQATAYPGFKLRLGQKLPANLWIQCSTEVNQRLDTNVFLTYKKPQPDYVFRAAPNVTVGYNLFNSNTSVYVQYFTIKDCYTVHHRPLTLPTTQSCAIGLRHQFQPWFKNRVSTYLDCQVRELWQSKGLRQADLSPSVNISYFATPKLTFFGSALLQMRSRQPFEGPQREMDPFYTLNMYYRTGKWVFSITDTFVTNFREPHFHYSIPKQGNVNMIADFEIDRQIGNHPGIQLFLRGEPVFNWRSNKAVGLSGFDFRLYSGLRVSFYKPSYGSTIKQIKKQLQQQDGDDPNALTTKKGKGKGKGKDDGKGTDQDKEKAPATPGGTTDPDKTSTAPDGTPVVSPPAAAYVPDAAVGEAIGRAFRAIGAPGAGYIVAPNVGAVAPTAAVAEKTSPMALVVPVTTSPLM